MSFLDSWVAFNEGRQDSLSQKYQNPQNTATGDQQEVFGDIGNIGRRESSQIAETPQSDFGNIGSRCLPESGPLACRQRLASPGQAGAVSWEALTDWKEAYPHLRPCPKAKDGIGGWMWVNRSECQGCPWAVTCEPKTLQ